MIGIYKITNPQGKSYIGQSKNIDKRIRIENKFLNFNEFLKMIKFTLISILI